MKKVLCVAAIDFNNHIVVLGINVPVMDDKCAKFERRASWE
jgi:hypothetical protein